MDSSFKNEKDLRYTFTMGVGGFGKNGNQKIVSGLRSVSEIAKAGGVVLSSAKCRIYGMLDDDMQLLTMLAWDSVGTGIQRNDLLIEAIDGDSVSTVFSGTIVNAWPDYQSAPDVFLYVEAIAGYAEKTTPMQTTSLKGISDVAVLMETYAKAMGLTFENNGVTAQLSNPYLVGDAYSQAQQLEKAANIYMFRDDTVLAICKKGTSRPSTQPVISLSTGLVGYPMFDRIGAMFTTYFNPAIKFGGTVKIETAVKRAAGIWQVMGLSHSLSSKMNGGPWFSNVRTTESGIVPIK